VTGCFTDSADRALKGAHIRIHENAYAGFLQCARKANEDKSAGFCIQAGSHCFVPTPGATAAQLFAEASSKGQAAFDCDANGFGAGWTNACYQFETAEDVVYYDQPITFSGYEAFRHAVPIPVHWYSWRITGWSLFRFSCCRAGLVLMNSCCITRACAGI